MRPDGREHVFEQFLQAKGLQRRVRLEVAHFMSLLPIISTSDLIATVPRDLADVCVRYGDIRMLDTPMKSPIIEVHQRREHEVAGQRRLDCGGQRFGVAHLADHDDVGILSQHRA